MNKSLCRFVLALSLVWAAGAGRVAASPADSSALAPWPVKRESPRFLQSDWYRITSVGVPLVAGGLLLQGSDHALQALSHSYMPRFKSSVDGYLQYLPGIAMLGLKIGGVEGRSSWGRMLVSDAFSAAAMATLVNATKYTVKRKRPDGTSDNSFPSGHTATAFMMATMMAKEYGGRSLWYSAGAYSVATATGVMRILNNRHYLSDVVAGAGIGILSTELGYFIGDLIFGDKGLRRTASEEAVDRYRHPSFVGLVSGYQFPAGRSGGASSGSVGGLEGAFFFSPYWGVGGRLAASNVRLAGGQYASALSADAGVYASYPVAARVLVGGKLLAGTNVTTGVSATVLLREHFGLRLFADYHYRCPYISEKDRMAHTFSVGGATVLSF